MDQREIERSLSACGHIAKAVYLRSVPGAEQIDAQVFWAEVRQELADKGLLAACSPESLTERVVVRARAKIREARRRERLSMRVHQLLWKLKPRHVSLVSLIYCEGETIERVAELEGTTIDEIRAELRVAKKTLNKHFQRSLKYLEDDLQDANEWHGWVQRRVNVFMDGQRKESILKSAHNRGR